ncbi:hypothetical protein GBA52_013958 [Prunus armeniaca]|nr:hypothetical protein GBA52_013958 [Prunus armeniaca]
MLPQLVVAEGSKKLFRTGPWNGIRFTGTPDAGNKRVVKPIYVYDTNELYYMYEATDSSILTRVKLSETGGTGKKDKRIILILVISAVSVLPLLALLCWYILLKKRGRNVSTSAGSRSIKEDWELPLFDFDTIATATNNFSHTNKLGEGGFGQVYKVTE